MPIDTLNVPRDHDHRSSCCTPSGHEFPSYVLLLESSWRCNRPPEHPTLRGILLREPAWGMFALLPQSVREPRRPSRVCNSAQDWSSPLIAGGACPSKGIPIGELWSGRRCRGVTIQGSTACRLVVLMLSARRMSMARRKASFGCEGWGAEGCAVGDGGRSRGCRTLRKSVGDVRDILIR